ncbi:MAG TPA: hypothetical protein VK123_06235 [Candidatus Limnocylindrales bacterium]|nr:hypothetical protein [Candidatus Limnocylindrales bacterium]
MAHGRAIPNLRHNFAALTALAALTAAACAHAGSMLTAEGSRPDSVSATLRVVTIPPGLMVLVDGVRVGRAPVGPLWVAAKTSRVQALPEDPRRFEPGRDTVVVSPGQGESVTATIDMRPSVLIRTAPESAALFLQEGAASGADSLLGETPYRALPSRLERRALRFSAAEHADSSVSGESILALAPQGGPITIVLRRVAPHLPPGPPRSPPLVRRRWFQIALIGAGAALTGTSAILRHEGDRWYSRYLSSSDPVQIEGFYNRTAHYDRLAGASLGGGQVLLTSGIFLLVTSVTR